MTAVSGAATHPGFLGLQRQLRTLLPQVDGVAADQPPLERLTSNSEPPRLISATVIEGTVLRARRVFGEAETGFSAFLDGTQASRVLAYADGVPVIHGTVAAVIRVRRNRRLTTWGRPVVLHRLYVPVRRLSAAWREALEALPVPLVDTSDNAPGAPELTDHPFALRDSAIHRVQKDREAAERELAERWCALEKGALFIDGGISGSERVAVSTCTVGVVKSHRTLYAEGEALGTILRLRLGERSSVFRITSPKRTTVSSWYLRLRDPAGHDPMWGLVRVEIAQPTRLDEPAIGERADEISRWIFAEITPLALPDARWDKMVYGVRDCEEFLRAIT